MRVFSSLLLAALAAGLQAQQVVTLSVEGTTTGLDLWNNISVTRVQVADAPAITFRFNPGFTPSMVAQRIMAGVMAQGCAASVSGDEVRIVSGPNGAPLQDGVDFGSNDTGIVGIAAGIDGTGPAGAVKTSGCTLPYVNPGANGWAGHGGVIGIDVDVERPGPAGPQLVRHQIQVPFLQYENVTQIHGNIHAALAASGIRSIGGDVLMPSPLNQIGTTWPGIQVDRDFDGYPVRRVAWRPGVQLDMRWMEVHAGREPVFGACDYGQPWNAAPASLPLVLYSAGVPQVGNLLNMLVQTRIANQFCVLVLGFDKAVVPLPGLGGALLLVEPTTATSFAGIADNRGDWMLQLWVPPGPAFLGAAVRWQAADMPPLGNLAQLRLSPAMVTYLWP